MLLIMIVPIILPAMVVLVVALQVAHSHHQEVPVDMVDTVAALPVAVLPDKDMMAHLEYMRGIPVVVVVPEVLVQPTLQLVAREF